MEHIQDYYIYNELDTTILVHFDLNTIKWDSVEVVPAQTRKLIHTYSYPWGTVPIEDPRFEDAVENIKVETIDTIIYLDESYWLWEKESKYHGVSTIKVDTAVFH